MATHSDTKESLVQDLNRKLEELEHKVQAYRHEMIAEFIKHYYHQAICQATSSEALNIKKSIQSALEDKYPAFVLTSELELSPHPEVESGHTQLSLELISANSASKTLLPSPPSVYGLPKVPDTPRGHEREKEFQGLFTPFFLPLLDSSPIPPALSPPAISTATATATTASFLLPEPAMTGTDLGGETDVAAAATGSADQHGSRAHLQQGRDMEGSSETGVQQGTSPAQLPHRPSPARRGTDDTTSSAVSDKSDSKVPKSALRRSSSVSKTPTQSPRRVRFEFQGTEVLPTASPQPYDFPSNRLVSRDKPHSFDEIVSNQEQADEPYLPRKISSSEALRQLSRTPLDDETTWTVVNPDKDEPAPEPSDEDTAQINTLSPVKTPPMTVEAIEARERLAAVSKNQSQKAEEETYSEDSSGDEYLSIGRSKSKKKQPVVSSHASLQGAQTEPSNSNTNEKENTKQPPKTAHEEKDQTSSEDYNVEDDDMFHFESGGLSAPPRPKRKPPRLKEENSEVSPPSSSRGTSDSVQGLYATSPAVHISRPNKSIGPPTPTTSRFMVGSLGSYKGKPVIMPIVKNSELNAQAESLGQFNTFVGGLDGRSGIDDGDLNSFRASIAQSNFSGEPRSLSERLMMEEALEHRNCKR